MKKFKDLDCVLLVDDDIPTNFIHRKVIEKAELDVHVQATTTAKEALEFLTYQGKYENTGEVPRPGIIFLDINMPGMSGWDFMAEYKKLNDAQKARIVVIMLTTSLNPDDKERAMVDEDIVTFLHKPLRVEAVNELAEKYFNK